MEILVFGPFCRYVSQHMRIAIAGGHGQIALRLTRLLVGRGDEVISLIRDPAQSDDVRAAGGAPAVCDLEQADAAQIGGAIEGAHAVVFAAGAGPGSGVARKETMDLGGALKLIEAAKTKDIKRFVMVSSVGANAKAGGQDPFAAYLRAKGLADDELMKSGLDYTIVRPTMLTDEEGDGLVTIDSHVGRGSVPRDDVAAVLAEVLHSPDTVGKLFEVIDGRQPVADALARLP